MALITFTQKDVDHMSREILGEPYEKVAAAIYPTPTYDTFLIPKKNGEQRIIHAPSAFVKLLQTHLLDYLYKISPKPRASVHGFVFDRSIVTNAKYHCSPRTQRILSLDIENFFPSITFYRVRGVFQKKPFLFSHNVATALAHLWNLCKSQPTEWFVR